MLFKPLPLDSPAPFPVNIFERIPENHPLHLISNVVNKSDISNIRAGYKGGGITDFAPKMMLKALFYSYLSTIYSCRTLDENSYLMGISGNFTPDFGTINNCRGQRIKHHILDLFA